MQLLQMQKESNFDKSYLPPSWRHRTLFQIRRVAQLLVRAGNISYEGVGTEDGEVVPRGKKSSRRERKDHRQVLQAEAQNPSELCHPCKYQNTSSTCYLKVVSYLTFFEPPRGVSVVLLQIFVQRDTVHWRPYCRWRVCLPHLSISSSSFHPICEARDYRLNTFYCV
jgi:hypothetical protein